MAVDAPFSLSAAPCHRSWPSACGGAATRSEARLCGAHANDTGTPRLRPSHLAQFESLAVLAVYVGLVTELTDFDFVVPSVGQRSDEVNWAGGDNQRELRRAADCVVPQLQREVIRESCGLGPAN